MVSEEKKTVISNVMLAVAMIILFAMAALPFFNIIDMWVRYVYAFGAVLALAARLTEHYKGKNLRISRLYRIGKVSAILFCISAYFFVYPESQPRAWIAFLMAGAVMQIYISFVYEHEVKKEAKKAAAEEDKKKKK